MEMAITVDEFLALMDADPQSPDDVSDPEIAEATHQDMNAHYEHQDAGLEFDDQCEICVIKLEFS